MWFLVFNATFNNISAMSWRLIKECVNSDRQQFNKYQQNQQSSPALID